MLRYQQWIFCVAVVLVWNHAFALPETEQFLKLAIRADTDLDKVLGMGKELLATGFNAGSGYADVWIRDLNTFTDIVCEVVDMKKVRQAIMMFFYVQGADGNIPDGYSPVNNQTYKNTVETDQETSLVQAVYKYINKSGEVAMLNEVVNGKTVAQRLEFALDYLLTNRYSMQYKLLWGGTTVDWGDVQPEDNPGVLLNNNSHPAIDIYDNAMFIIAAQNFISLVKSSPIVFLKWAKVLEDLKANVRKYLWTGSKFVPHIYLEKGSPFPQNFNEQAIYYNGGTAVAIQAGLLSKDEISTALQTMAQNQQKAGAQSLGLTVYPAYPEGYWHNSCCGPYSYQNGGDWTWFGGRMIQGLIENGFVEEAHQFIQPMIQRVIKNHGFYEWYSLSGAPQGSADFKGSAGVLGKAIEMMQAWAKEG